MQNVLVGNYFWYFTMCVSRWCGFVFKDSCVCFFSAIVLLYLVLVFPWASISFLGGGIRVAFHWPPEWFVSFAHRSVCFERAEQTRITLPPSGCRGRPYLS